MSERLPRHQFLQTASALGLGAGLGPWDAVSAITPATADEAKVGPEMVRYRQNRGDRLRSIGRRFGVHADRRLVTSRVGRPRKPIEVVLVDEERGELVGELGFTLQQHVAVENSASLDRLEIRGNHFIKPLFAFRVVAGKMGRNTRHDVASLPSAGLQAARARAQGRGQGSSSSARKAFSPR
jgi:hypothetical protein